MHGWNREGHQSERGDVRRSRTRVFFGERAGGLGGEWWWRSSTSAEDLEAFGKESFGITSLDNSADGSKS